MLRETIRVNTESDVDAIVTRLRKECANAGLAPTISEFLLQQLGDLLRQLVEQGKRIAAVGSQMEVTRDLNGDGYSIRIIFHEKVRKSFVQKLFDLFSGQ